MQTAKVNLLLLIMWLAGAENIQTAGPGAKAGQFVNIKEAKTEDKLVLGRTHIFSQNHLAAILFAQVLHPLIGTLAGNGVLIYDDAILLSDVRNFRLQQ